MFADTKIISFISASGGVGKTKLSLLFSCFLKKKFHSRVLLIDLDPSAASSMYLLNDSELDECMEWKSLAGMMEDRKKTSVKFEKYRKTPMLYRERIDFLAPGDTRQVVDMVNDLWKSASAGAVFLDAIKETIPISDYEFIIFDTIPFFDPRYTQLVLYPSNYIVIPLRPNLVDLKRTNRMVSELREELRHKIKYDGLDLTVGRFMKQKIFYGFNLVPSRESIRENQFVRYYLSKSYSKKDLNQFYSTSDEEDFKEHNIEDMNKATKERSKTLEHHTEILNNHISLIPAYIGNYRYIDRFPDDDNDNKTAYERAKPFLNALYRNIT